MKKFTLGRKKKFGTYHPDTIFNENGDAILLVYGIPTNTTLEDLPEKYGDILKQAQMIVDALNLHYGE